MTTRSSNPCQFMIRIVTNFLLFVFLILPVQSNATVRESSSLHHLHANLVSAVFQQQEPKKPAIQPPKKANLWKSLLEFLKFKSRANKKLDTSIFLAIKKMGLKDSITATSANVRIIIAELRKTKYPDIDSLQSVLSARIQKLEQNKAGTDVTTPSNEDLNALANQLIPLLDRRAAPEQNNIDKFEKLRALNKVKSADPKTVYTLKVSDSITKKYTLQLKNRVEVYGFFDAAYPANTNAFFNAATSLIYYALPVNESTGSFDQLNGWDTAPVIDKAQKSGSKVYFTVLISGKNTKSALLFNPEVQKKAIANILLLLKKRNADGINISFKYLPKFDKKYFSEFVKNIHESLQAENPAYKLLITVPRTNFDGAYDVEELNKYTDRFFIDFASNTAPKGAPLAPLAGKGQENIDASYTWYLAHGMTAEKLVIILPYRGVKSAVDPVSMAPRLFSGYLQFNKIKSNSQSTAFYSAENETAYIDTVYNDLSSYRIWYDDEVTLAKKYNYVLKNNVAGVGLYYINYDDTFNVLNDELMYKFSYIDTVYQQSPPVVVRPHISFLEQIRRHVILWDFILQHPCATCFQSKLASPEDRAKVDSYINDLQIYTLVREEKVMNAKGLAEAENVKSQGISYREVFNFVNKEFNTFLKYLSLIFLAISLIGIILYIWGLRYYGSAWHYQKLSAGILFTIISLLVLFGFTFFFTSDQFAIFGTSPVAASSPDCVIDLKCINIPFNTLLAVIVVSILFGFLIFHYLITPLIKRDDQP